MKSYRIILAILILSAMLNGCDNSHDSVQNDQKQVSSPNTYAKNSTYTVNGQTVQYYSVPFPLENIPLTELKTRVENNDAEAIAELGRRYSSGNGVSQDIAKAKQLYIKAAKAGNPTAQNELAGAYEYGLFGNINLEQAIYWYEKAANQGFAPAQYNLGVSYEFGTGVAVDQHIAHEWYLKAANQNFPAAIDALAKQYQNGRGISKNIDKAIELYKKAAEKGFPGAQYNLGYMYFTGYDLDKNISSAIYWYNKASENGHEGAQINLATIYLFGSDVKTDYEKAYKLFDIASKNGYYKYDGLFNLAQMYENGLFVSKNLIKSYALYSLSKERLKISQLETSPLTENDILDSLNTLKAQMTPEQIQAGEREIANVIREYGVTL